MQGAAKVGSGERDGQREAQACLVQLIDGNDHEWPGLYLLGSPSRVRVGPVDLTLLGPSAYHSGVGAPKPDSISRLSAR